MTVYAVAFPKGGTTKTTTAADLTAYLVARGRRVLAIDLDEQGTLSAWLGFTDATEINGTTAGVLTGCVEVLDAATPAPSVPGADMLVGTHDLGQVDYSQVPDLVTSLRDALPGVTGRYDDVVIDAPPALSGLTLAALAAADKVVAPVACEGQAVHQLERFREVISYHIARRVRKGQRIHSIIPTRYDGRRILDREVVLGLRNTYGEEILVTDPIRESQAVKESYVSQLPVSLYDASSNPAQDYARAFRRIVEED